MDLLSLSVLVVFENFSRNQSGGLARLRLVRRCRSACSVRLSADGLLLLLLGSCKENRERKRDKEKGFIKMDKLVLLLVATGIWRIQLAGAN